MEQNKSKAKKAPKDVFCGLHPDTHQTTEANHRRPEGHLSSAHAERQKGVTNTYAETPVNPFSTAQSWLICNFCSHSECGLDILLLVYFPLHKGSGFFKK